MAAVDKRCEPSLCPGEQTLLQKADRSKNRSKVTSDQCKSVNPTEKPLDLRPVRSDRQSEHTLFAELRVQAREADRDWSPSGQRHSRSVSPNKVALAVWPKWEFQRKKLNRSPQGSFLPQKCLVLSMSQALYQYYLTRHFPNTFADVFVECDMKSFKRSSCKALPPIPFQDAEPMNQNQN